MEFHVNHPILFLLAGILVAVVLAQSVYFLVKALRRSREIGMDQAKIRKTIQTAARFSGSRYSFKMASATASGLFSENIPETSCSTRSVFPRISVQIMGIPLPIASIRATDSPSR